MRYPSGDILFTVTDVELRDLGKREKLQMVTGDVAWVKSSREKCAE